MKKFQKAFAVVLALVMTFAVATSVSANPNFTPGQGGVCTVTVNDGTIVIWVTGSGANIRFHASFNGTTVLYNVLPVDSGTFSQDMTVPVSAYVSYNFLLDVQGNALIGVFLIEEECDDDYVPEVWTRQGDPVANFVGGNIYKHRTGNANTLFATVNVTVTYTSNRATSADRVIVTPVTVYVPTLVSGNFQRANVNYTTTVVYEGPNGEAYDDIELSFFLTLQNRGQTLRGQGRAVPTRYEILRSGVVNPLF